jgi:hypothetical protein
LDFSPGLPEKNIFKSKFFHYTEYSFCRKSLSRAAFEHGLLPRRECLLSSTYIERNLWRIAQTYVLPVLIVPETDIPIEDRLVIHLRSGDVASLSHDYYATNPLWFYRQLAKMYDDVVIVSEPGHRHVLFEFVASLFERIEFVSGNVQEDFTQIRFAKHIATSGVGTFPIAASLLSCCIQTLHCTDLFQKEHLNPLMLMGVDGIKVDLMKMPGFQRQWLNAADRLQLLLNYEPPEFMN